MESNYTILELWMSAEFIEVSSVDDLNMLFEQSAAATVILYNHDPYCPISARAIREMHLVNDTVALIDVSRGQQLTREIAERTGIRHESPQVIVLKDGHPTWNASHFAITAAAVEQATSST
jgi:bacillithiol system protein YtxJ